MRPGYFRRRVYVGGGLLCCRVISDDMLCVLISKSTLHSMPAQWTRNRRISGSKCRCGPCRILGLCTTSSPRRSAPTTDSTTTSPPKADGRPSSSRSAGPGVLGAHWSPRSSSLLDRCRDLVETGHPKNSPLLGGPMGTPRSARPHPPVQPHGRTGGA